MLVLQQKQTTRHVSSLILLVSCWILMLMMMMIMVVHGRRNEQSFGRSRSSRHGHRLDLTKPTTMTTSFTHHPPPSSTCWKYAVSFLQQTTRTRERQQPKNKNQQGSSSRSSTQQEELCHNMNNVQQKILAMFISSCHLHDLGRDMFQPGGSCQAQFQPELHQPLHQGHDDDHDSYYYDDDDSYYDDDDDSPRHGRYAGHLNDHSSQEDSFIEPKTELHGREDNTKSHNGDGNNNKNNDKNYQDNNPLHCLKELTNDGMISYTHYISHVQILCVRLTQESLLEHQQDTQRHLLEQQMHYSNTFVQQWEQINSWAQQHEEQLQFLTTTVLPNQLQEQLLETLTQHMVVWTESQLVDMTNQIQQELSIRFNEIVNHHVEYQKQAFDIFWETYQQDIQIQQNLVWNQTLIQYQSQIQDSINHHEIQVQSMTKQLQSIQNHMKWIEYSIEFISNTIQWLLQPNTRKWIYLIFYTLFGNCMVWGYFLLFRRRRQQPRQDEFNHGYWFSILLIIWGIALLGAIAEGQVQGLLYNLNYYINQILPLEELLLSLESWGFPSLLLLTNTIQQGLQGYGIYDIRKWTWIIQGLIYLTICFIWRKKTTKTTTTTATTTTTTTTTLGQQQDQDDHYNKDKKFTTHVSPLLSSVDEMNWHSQYPSFPPYYYDHNMSLVTYPKTCSTNGTSSSSSTPTTATTTTNNTLPTTDTNNMIGNASPSIIQSPLLCSQNPIMAHPQQQQHVNDKLPFGPNHATARMATTTGSSRGNHGLGVVGGRPLLSFQQQQQLQQQQQVSPTYSSNSNGGGGVSFPYSSSLATTTTQLQEEEIVVELPLSDDTQQQQQQIPIGHSFHKKKIKRQCPTDWEDVVMDENDDNDNNEQDYSIATHNKCHGSNKRQCCRRGHDDEEEDDPQCV